MASRATNDVRPFAGRQSVGVGGSGSVAVLVVWRPGPRILTFHFTRVHKPLRRIISEGFSGIVSNCHNLSLGITI